MLLFFVVALSILSVAAEVCRVPVEKLKGVNVGKCPKNITKIREFKIVTKNGHPIIEFELPQHLVKRSIRGAVPNPEETRIEIPSSSNTVFDRKAKIGYALTSTGLAAIMAAAIDVRVAGGDINGIVCAVLVTCGATSILTGIGFQLAYIFDGMTQEPAKHETVSEELEHLVAASKESSG